MTRPMHRDGTINVNDQMFVLNNWGSGQFPTTDYELDGGLDNNDLLNVLTNWGAPLARCTLSQSDAAGGNRHGYAGYEFEPVIMSALCHVRNRVLNSDLARWTRRDPMDYADELSQYQYTRLNPVTYSDYSGLTTQVNLIDVYYAPPPVNSYAHCGKIECHAKFVSIGPYCPSGPTYFVAKIESSGVFDCCGYTTILWGGFWELWSVAPPGLPIGTPWQVANDHTITYGVHIASDGARRTTAEPRAICGLNPADSSWIPSLTTGASAPYTYEGSICNVPQSATTNAITLQQPLDWDQAVNPFQAKHIAKSNWNCCNCKGVTDWCSTTSSAECVPGGCDTCTAPGAAK